MTSLIAKLSEQQKYGTVDSEIIQDALLELEDYQDINQSPNDIKEALSELESYQSIKIDGKRYKTAAELESAIEDLINFKRDIDLIAIDYLGAIDDGDSILKAVTNCIIEFDELKTAIEDGESLDYIKTIIEEVR